MEFAYIDESGDYGAKGSKNLVMCLVCTNEKKRLNKIIRNVKKRLLDKNKTAYWLNHNGGKIKFYGFPDKDLLKRILKELADLEIKIYYTTFNKTGKSVDKDIKISIMPELYKHILEEANKIKPQKITADLDYFGKKPYYFNLLNYTKSEGGILGEDGNKKKKFKTRIGVANITEQDYNKMKDNKNAFVVKIETLNSGLSEELQAVDLICGSIFQFIEHNNSEYYDIIKKRIISENEHIEKD